MSVRWEPPWNSVTWERARAAMVRSEVGVMIWSPLLMKYHDGIDFQAACVAGVSNAAVVAGGLAPYKPFSGSGGQSVPWLSTKEAFLKLRAEWPPRSPADPAQQLDCSS